MSRNNEGMGTWMTLGVSMSCRMLHGKKAFGQAGLTADLRLQLLFLEKPQKGVWGDNEVPLQGCTQLSASPMIKNFQREGFCVNSFSNLQNSPEHMAKKLQLALFLGKLISRKEAFL